MYLFSIFLPLALIVLENKGHLFAEIVYVIASKYLMMMSYDKKAKKFILNLIDKYPESYKGHELLAKIYERENEMEKAIDEYVLAVDRNSKDYKSYYKIAELLNNLGKKDEAIEMLNHLLDTKPEIYEASMLLGSLLCEQERFKEAVSVYMDALKYTPVD